MGKTKWYAHPDRPHSVIQVWPDGKVWSIDTRNLNAVEFYSNIKEPLLLIEATELASAEARTIRILPKFYARIEAKTPGYPGTLVDFVLLDGHKRFMYRMQMGECPAWLLKAKVEHVLTVDVLRERSMYGAQRVRYFGKSRSYIRTVKWNVISADS